MVALFSTYWPHISVVSILALVAAGFKVAKRMYRKQRRRDDVDDFVVAMATNHLPHIYDALLRIGTAVGVNSETPPPIATISKE